MKSLTIIIGGLGLIGKKIVETHLKAKMRVEVWDIRLPNKIEKSLYKKYKDRITFQVVDITSEKKIVKAINLSAQKDYLISNVINVSYPKNNDYGNNFRDVSFKNFTDNVSLHLGAYFLVLKVFSEKMSKLGGNIVNLSSIYGSKVPRFEIYKDTNMTVPIEYVAIKSGIESISKYFAKTYIKTKLRINCVAPGGVFDNQDKKFLKKYKKHCGLIGMLSGEEIADMILWLTTRNTAITGQTIIIDDGFTL